jgi:TetR/AcrR family transcriptional repressor of nem operon
MPWEKSFEKSDVIERTMHLFWEKGYSATSISDITRATGIQRGSLYNAFDGKDELFVESLLRYDRATRQTILTRLQNVDDPKQAILLFFDGVVKDSCEDPCKRGCFLVNTALDYSRHESKVQEMVSAAFVEIVDFFEASIRRGQELEAIPATVEPASTANALVAMLVGIRVLGRGVFAETALKQVADQAERMLS